MWSLLIMGVVGEAKSFEFICTTLFPVGEELPAMVSTMWSVAIEGTCNVLTQQIYDDIILWCHLMTSSCEAILWCHLVMSSCDVRHAFPTLQWNLRYWRSLPPSLPLQDSQHIPYIVVEGVILMVPRLGFIDCFSIGAQPAPWGVTMETDSTQISKTSSTVQFGMYVMGWSAQKLYCNKPLHVVTALYDYSEKEWKTIFWFCSEIFQKLFTEQTLYRINFLVQPPACGISLGMLSAMYLYRVFGHPESKQFGEKIWIFTRMEKTMQFMDWYFLWALL